MSEKETSTKKSNGIFIIIILLLMGGMAYMAYTISSKNKEIDKLEKLVKEKDAEIQGINDMMSGYVNTEDVGKDLRKDFQNMLDTYDALIEKDASKSDSLNVQKVKIQSLIDQLNRNKRLSAKQLYDMKRENETLRGIMKGYILQIDSLNTLNLKLTSELDTKSSQLTSTIEERNQYKSEAENNAAQVKKGAKLQAYNFSSSGLKMKMNNMPEESSKARTCEQIKSSFTISENPITPAGRKVVYMQIINPEGRTLQTKSSYVVQTDAGTIAYSDKKDIDYNNQRVDVAIYYNLEGEEAVKGNYKVKIYCDGQLIGTDSFTLK